MKSIRSSLLATTLSIIGITSAAAAQTPNFYQCTGKNVNLSLTVGSKAEVSIWPQPTTLNLRVGKKRYSFQEADITTEKTMIGDLWEVTLKHIPDLHIDNASIIIPSISLGDSPIKFKSQLILTRLETPFTQQAFEGVFNASKYIDISCVASILYF